MCVAMQARKCMRFDSNALQLQDKHGAHSLLGVGKVRAHVAIVHVVEVVSAGDACEEKRTCKMALRRGADGTGHWAR